jgi:hypothetical protein
MTNECEILATFESKLRPNADMEELTKLSEKLHELAIATPKIGEIKSSYWNRDDGAILSIFTFKSMDAMNEFVNHPEHQLIMKRGKEFFASVHTQIATIERRSVSNFDA